MLALPGLGQVWLVKIRRSALFQSHRKQTNVYEFTCIQLLPQTRAVSEAVFVVLLKAFEKLKRQLAEAEAELEERKKPPEDNGPKMIGEGLVIDEWVS